MSNLYEPHSYINATQQERDTICNGCGSSKAKFDFVPDTVYGLCITPACNIHDFMYYKAKPFVEFKEEADRIFLNNMLRLVEKKGGLLKHLRRRRAYNYYRMVDMFGGPAFWSDKN